jgi:hypothetical protein
MAEIEKASLSLEAHPTSLSKALLLLLGGPKATGLETYPESSEDAVATLRLLIRL